MGCEFGRKDSNGGSQCMRDNTVNTRLVLLILRLLKLMLLRDTHQLVFPNIYILPATRSQNSF
jgi:hypothetical protein